MTHYPALLGMALAALLIGATAQANVRATSRVHEMREQGDFAHWRGETGEASYYGPAFQGRRSANGTVFNQNALTAAHPWLPFGKRVKVRLAGTNRSVVVTITDRLHARNRVVDLSFGAARRLGMVHRGLALVTLAPA